MSKQKPYTPKAVAEAKAPETCSGCRHWKEQGFGLGRCTARPPAIVSEPTGYGPLCVYPVTRADTPACGEAS